ncbi:MAG: hypothetical protein V2B19_33575 [Pseudomonadota bacterium]
MDDFIERRAHERFDLVLPCLLLLNQDHVFSDVIELETRNIGHGGVFLEPVRHNGSNVATRLDILIPSRLIKCGEGRGTCISISGSIVRSGPGGTAISFSEDYRISSLDKVLGLLKRKLEWMERQKRLMAPDDRSKLLYISGRLDPSDPERSRMEKV